MCGYRAADLHFCLAYVKNRFSRDAAHMMSRRDKNIIVSWKDICL